MVAGSAADAVLEQISWAGALNPFSRNRPRIGMKRENSLRLCSSKPRSASAHRHARRLEAVEKVETTGCLKVGSPSLSSIGERGPKIGKSASAPHRLQADLVRK